MFASGSAIDRTGSSPRLARSQRRKMMASSGSCRSCVCQPAFVHASTDRRGGDRMGDAALWADYLSYLRRARDASGPLALFDGYRHELAAAGVAADVIDARLARLSELILERDDWAA